MIVLFAGFLFSEAFWGGEPAWRDDEEERGHNVKFSEKKTKNIFPAKKYRIYFLLCLIKVLTWYAPGQPPAPSHGQQVEVEEFRPDKKIIFTKSLL